MSSNEYLLSCDWGSSSFRLRLLSLQSKKILAESSNSSGVLYFNQDQSSDKDQKYSNFLEKEIQFIEKEHNYSLNNIPLICSGMISSSKGWIELNYAKLPFSLTGDDLIYKTIKTSLRDITLISGVCDELDIMRGEEMEILGLVNSNLEIPKQCLIILPGTHSKHVYINNGQITKFITYMTGEMFHLLSSHSVLKESVLSDTVNKDILDPSSFQKGLHDSQKPWLNALFTVRTQHILKKQELHLNHAYLSGLLIGAELSSLRETPGIPIIIIASQQLRQPYDNALECLRLSQQNLYQQELQSLQLASLAHLHFYKRNFS